MSDKLYIPVMNAKIVPSIPKGVILAKRDKHGSINKAIEVDPEMISVRKTNAISLIPIYLFQRRAQAIEPKLEIHDIVIAQNMIVLVSHSFNYSL